MTMRRVLLVVGLFALAVPALSAGGVSPATVAVSASMPVAPVVSAANPDVVLPVELIEVPVMPVVVVVPVPDAVEPVQAAIVPVPAPAMVVPAAPVADDVPAVAAPEPVPVPTASDAAAVVPQRMVTRKDGGFCYQTGVAVDSPVVDDPSCTGTVRVGGVWVYDKQSDTCFATGAGEAAFVKAPNGSPECDPLVDPLALKRRRLVP